jgi:hypothetical protein
VSGERGKVTSAGGAMPGQHRPLASDGTIQPGQSGHLRPSAIPQSTDVIGPPVSAPSESLLEVLEGTASYDPAAICSANSVQSVSLAPVNHPPRPRSFGGIPGLAGTSGMSDLYQRFNSNDAGNG